MSLKKRLHAVDLISKVFKVFFFMYYYMHIVLHIY